MKNLIRSIETKLKQSKPNISVFDSDVLFHSLNMNKKSYFIDKINDSNNLIPQTSNLTFSSGIIGHAWLINFLRLMNRQWMKMLTLGFGIQAVFIK